MEVVRVEYGDRQGDVERARDADAHEQHEPRSGDELQLV